MLRRMMLAAGLTAVLAIPASGQDNATLLMRSGEKLAGQLIDMGGIGFTMRVNGEERQVDVGDVAAIEFVAGGREAADPPRRRPGEGQATVWLRTGEAVDGQLYDIAGTHPLRIVLKTSAGERQFASSEVGRIVLSADAQPAGTSGSSPAAAPDGSSVEVPATAAWVPTGMVVRRGELLSFTTTGQIRLSADAEDLASAAGARSQRQSPGSPMPSISSGALIGRIGDGAPFSIGDQTSTAMPAAGQLFLGINDDQLADNSGAFRVTVQRPARR
jgi:hypothetical protein